MRARRTVVLEEYRKHVLSVPLRGLRPNPWMQTKWPPCRAAEKPARGRRRIPVRSVTNRVPPGVDEAAYVKAGFLALSPKAKLNPRC